MRIFNNKFKASLLLGTSALLLAACGNGDSNGAGNETNDTGGELIEVTIPSYKSGQNVGARLFLGQVERFNETYEGQYQLNIEEVPQDAYGELIQQLAQQNSLPVIVHAPGSGSIDNQWFENVVIENNLYHDMSGWLEENPEAEDLMLDEFIDFNTTEEGTLVSVPDYRVRSPFLYYNETMYNPDTNIRDMSMEEFSESLGENKIAFMTGENAWTTGLFWSAIIANEPGGADMLLGANAGEFTELDDPIIVESIDKLKTFMQEHGASNTLGAIFADAANAFMSENAAVIPNGPWMTVDFEEESSDKWSNDFHGSDVRGDYFPGNIGLQSYEAYGDWVSANSSEEEIELAEAWFTFLHTSDEIETALLAEGGQAPNFEPSEEYLNQLEEDQILSDIENATSEETVFVPNILDVLPSSIGDSELSRFLPLLLNEEMTPQEFGEELANRARQAIQ